MVRDGTNHCCNCHKELSCSMICSILLNIRGLPAAALHGASVISTLFSSGIVSVASSLLVTQGKSHNFC